MKSEELKQKAKHELIEYAVNVAYLAIVFAAFTWYRRLILASYDITYTNYWFALIQALILGEAQAAVAASETLGARGILVPAIRPPTVPEGSARLRITLCALHSEQQVARLLDALAALAARTVSP